jgi:hypothetical protein
MAHCRQVISAASLLRTQAQRWLQIEDEYLGSVEHGAPSCGHSAAKKRHLHGNSFATDSRRSARSPSYASTSCSRQSWHRDAAINQAEILKTKSSMRTVKHTQQPRLKKTAKAQLCLLQHQACASPVDTFEHVQHRVHTICSPKCPMGPPCPTVHPLKSLPRSARARLCTRCRTKEKGGPIAFVIGSRTSG